MAFALADRSSRTQPWLRHIRAVQFGVMTYLQTLTRWALALIAFAAFVSHGVAARAETTSPFLVCERDAAFELARAYEASEETALDALERLAVAERCFRHPPGWTFEIAEVATGPLKSFDGLPFYVVRIDVGNLYALTWRTKPLRVEPEI